jgi:hypothetical protein
VGPSIPDESPKPNSKSPSLSAAADKDGAPQQNQIAPSVLSVSSVVKIFLS